MKTLADVYTFEDLKEGMIVSFNRTFTLKDGIDFSLLSGNMNPLHIDEVYGKKSKFNDIIVYGMLTASLFSTLLGMYCPGERSLCLSQTLEFRKALYYGETVEVKGTVLEKYNSIKLVKIKTEILRGTDTIVFGEAKVQLLDL